VQARLDKVPKPVTIKGRFEIDVLADDVDAAKKELEVLLAAWLRVISVKIDWE